MGDKKTELVKRKSTSLDKDEEEKVGIHNKKLYSKDGVRLEAHIDTCTIVRLVSMQDKISDLLYQ